MLLMWEICACARPSERKRVVLSLNNILSKNESITV